MTMDDGAASKKTTTTEVVDVGEGMKMGEIDDKENSADNNDNDKDAWARKHPYLFPVLACIIKSCECFCTFLCFPCTNPNNL